MRSIVTCNTHVQGSELERILEEYHWLPGLAQDNATVRAKAREILEQVADAHREMVEQTLQFTIYNSDTDTWGIISREVKNALVIRLKNADSRYLRQVTEKLVDDLEDAGRQRWSGVAVEFKFHQDVRVLEKNSERSAYKGHFLHGGGFLSAVRERQNETAMVVVTALVTIGLWVVTFPNHTPDSATLAGIQREWQIQWLGRLGTATMLTATLGIIEIILHWWALARRKRIQWDHT